eukprot:6207388-Pleurochrysis_carterae.AAC.1
MPNQAANVRRLSITRSKKGTSEVLRQMLSPSALSSNAQSACDRAKQAEALACLMLMGKWGIL